MSTGPSTCAVCFKTDCGITNSSKCMAYQLKELKDKLAESEEQVEFWYDRCSKWAAGEFD